jgi:hypothetical protein
MNGVSRKIGVPLGAERGGKAAKYSAVRDHHEWRECRQCREDLPADERRIPSAEVSSPLSERTPEVIRQRTLNV